MLAADHTSQFFKVHARRNDDDGDGNVNDTDDNDNAADETVDVQISLARYCDTPAGGKTLTLTTPTQSWTIVESGTPLAVMSRGPPSHDGRNKFSLHLTTSDPVANTRDEMRERVVRVRGGRVDTAEPVDGRTDSWELTVAPDGPDDVVVTVGGGGSCDDPATLCTEDGEPFSETSATVEGPGGAAALTASFEEVPHGHDGETPFTMYLAFSAPVANSAAELADHAVAVSGGSVAAVEAIDGRGDLWLVAVTPDGAADVVVTVEAGGSCADPGTLCTASGEALSATATATVVAEPAPLTVSFANAPASHDGETRFTVEAVFSEAPAVDNRAVRKALRVVGGTLRKMRRVNRDAAHRIATVEPHGPGPVRVWFEATADCADAGALCTAAGGRLKTPVDIIVEGPPVLSVSDAAVTEGPGATLDFVVGLSHAAAGAITAEYETGDGTAAAGSDYVAVEGTLTFAPGETEKTVSVAVHDDGVDEGEETMTLSARVQGAVGGGGPAAGTGTIGDPGPPGVAPLTVSFANAPVEHDGGTPFTVELVFSEAPHGMKSRDIRKAMQVEGASTVSMRKVDGNAARRLATVRPYTWRDVVLTLPAAADCADARALCTAAGGRLEEPVTATVAGPLVVVVWSVSAQETQSEFPFRVQLSRASAAPVSVDYRTVDGTATAGADYVAVEGTLTFAPGETEKTVYVTVLDDAHDEGTETFTLALSNAVGARLWHTEGVGSIENTDLMPQAWLGRFGRTVADQVLDAVEGRMRAPRASGAEVRLAGQRLGLGPRFGTEAAPEGGEEAAALRARESEAEAAQAGRRLAAWLSGAADEEDRSGVETRTVSERELLLGSSFSLTAGAADGAGGSASLWGRAAVSRFDGREGDLTLDGEVASGLLGADWARGRWTTGLVVSHSRGEGGYRGRGRRGDGVLDLDGRLSLGPACAERAGLGVGRCGLRGGHADADAGG